MGVVNSIWSSDRQHLRGIFQCSGCAGDSPSPRFVSCLHNFLSYTVVADGLRSRMAGTGNEAQEGLRSLRIRSISRACLLRLTTQCQISNHSPSHYFTQLCCSITHRTRRPGSCQFCHLSEAQTAPLQVHLLNLQEDKIHKR